MSGDGTEIRIHSPSDFHVHLRQGEMCRLVTPLVRTGGFKTAYVMVSAQLRCKIQFTEVAEFSQT